MLVNIRKGAGGDYSYFVGNCDRSIGARISGEIALVWGNLGMSDMPIKLRLTGTAGQSLGVWNAGGLNIELEATPMTMWVKVWQAVRLLFIRRKTQTL
nr:hypothetical protein [Psychrobacter sp. JCM 18900]